MSKSEYKLKIAGKVIGPINRDQFDKIIAGAELTGNEQYQENSSGEWKPVSGFLSDQTLFLNLDKIEKEVSKEKGEKLDFIDEILRDQNVEFRVDIENKEDQPNDDEDEGGDLSKTIEVKEISDRPEADRTLVRPLSKEEKAEFDKVKEERKKKKLQQKQKKDLRDKDKKKVEEKSKQLEVVEKKEVVSFEDKTMVISLSKAKKKIIEEIKDSEKALAGIDNVKEESDEEVVLIESEESNTKEKKKNKKLLIKIIAVAALGFLLADMAGISLSKKKGLKPIPPKMTFPSKLQFKEPAKSKELEQEGDRLYTLGGYLNTFKASRLYSSTLR